MGGIGELQAKNSGPISLDLVFECVREQHELSFDEQALGESKKPL